MVGLISRREGRHGPSGDDRGDGDLVAAAGGEGIAVQVDHTVPEQVESLFARVAAEQDGRLDILVNDIWGGDPLTEWDKSFWELDLAKVAQLLSRAVLTHVITSRYGVPLIVARRSGLVVEVTDGHTDSYRGNLAYDLVKSSVIRLAKGMAEELRPHGVAALPITPGFLRSEAMLDHFGMTADNWRDGVAKDPHFIASETPPFVGWAVAALAADPGVMEKSGRALSSWDLSDEYGFDGADGADGARPHWGRYFAGIST